MKIALAQINPVIADIEGNRDRIIACIVEAAQEGAGLIVFPELAVIGYPPMDLLEFPKLIDDNEKALASIAEKTRDIAAIVGFVHRDDRGALYNSAAFLCDGAVQSLHHKTLLPTYDVFDEGRYFTPAADSLPVRYLGKKIGITICEDIWNRDLGDAGRFMEGQRYRKNPVADHTRSGVDIIVNLSASPFVSGKQNARIALLKETALSSGADLIYVNQVGGNDSLVFDGNSMAFNRRGELTARARGFAEDLIYVETGDATLQQVEPEDEIEEIRQALVLGLEDYVKKCGFKQVVLGLSGGIDSALCAVLAVEALGPENVLGITMPSRYSSRGSVDDSRALAKNTGITIEEIAINELVSRFGTDLNPIFREYKEDITEENIQARIRGVILMAVSNKTGRLLLTTGNKSELAMGYCTLYGDMAGGLALISDLFKTDVYRLARHINRDHEIIPSNSIDKAPSAELRPDQKDQDTLPPYELLDRILELYIEERKPAREIIARGHDADLVKWVLRMVNLNEYKRRQAPPGIKVTSKAFGTGRRIPLAQRFQP